MPIGMGVIDMPCSLHVACTVVCLVLRIDVNDFSHKGYYYKLSYDIFYRFLKELEEDKYVFSYFWFKSEKFDACLSIIFNLD